MRREERKLIRGIYDYLIIAMGMLVGSLGWVAFLLPNKITIGGLPGVSSIVYWGMGIPVQYTYLAINVLLLTAALRTLGLKFCVKTIYAVLFFTIFTTVWQHVTDVLVKIFKSGLYVAHISVVRISDLHGMSLCLLVVI